nr:barstar family protein [Streptomyces mangrovisoli]
MADHSFRRGERKETSEKAEGGGSVPDASGAAPPEKHTRPISATTQLLDRGNLKSVETATRVPLECADSGEAWMRASEPGGTGWTYTLTSDEDDSDWGFAQGAEGFFTPLPGGEGDRRVRFVGCAPQGALLRSLDHLGTHRATAGSAWIGLLDAEGAKMGTYFVSDVRTTEVRPSACGADLLDITATLWCDMSLPGADRVWDLIAAGRLNRTGLWHAMDADGRRAWLSVALMSRGYRRQGATALPPGHVVTLDGRHIVDEDSFYCAIGEAVNGPGGYFGWNLAALDDCLCGGFGTAGPFTLVWESSAEARARVEEAEPRDPGEEPLFGVLLDIFRDRGVDVVLR